MRITFRLFVGMIVLVVSALGAISGPAFAQTLETGSRLLFSGSMGRVVTAGQYIFWVGSRGMDYTIEGYDLAAQRQFTVSEEPGFKFGLTTDGGIIAWVQDRLAGTLAKSAIQSYDPASRRQSNLLATNDLNGFAGIALENGTLFYYDSTVSHRGFFARDLTTGKEQMISSGAQDPVAGDGTLLWSTERLLGPYGPNEGSLHLRRLDGSVEDKVIATQQGGLAGYSVSGDHVVWSFFPPASDTGVYVYNLRNDVSTRISGPEAGVTEKPFIRGQIVIWSEAEKEGTNSPARFTVKAYDLASQSRWTVVRSGNTGLLGWGLIESTDLIYTIPSEPGSAISELRMIPLKPPAPTPTPAALIAPFADTPDQQYFPQTGHSLSFGFKSFWERNDGLSVFGYPLTEEFQEKNPDDEHTYTVQYFERARFECHPELKGTPFETELGLLGTQVLETRGWR